MANDNTKLQYIVELLTQGDTKKAADELGKLAKATDGASKGMTSATDSAKQLFAFLGGSALIKDSLDKFLEAERGVNALNAALIQTRNDAPGALAEVLALADALGDDLKVQADDVVKVMTQLVTFGANPRDLRKLTEAVYDLSEVMGRDVGRASRQMSQALRGNFEVFNALGIEVDKTKFATDGFNEAFEKMVGMINGRARLSVQGVAGDVQGLKVTLEDAKQQLGEWSAAVLTAAANVGANLARLMARPELESAIKAQKDQYLALADAIAKAILEAEKLGRITKGEAGAMFGKLGGARELLRGGMLDIGATTSDEDVRRMQETVLPQAGGLLSGLQKRLGAPGAIGGSSGTPPKPDTDIETPGLSEKDFEATIEHWNELADLEQQFTADQIESRRLFAQVMDEQLREEVEAFQNGERIIQDLADQTLLTKLEGEARIQAEMQINHEERVRMINEEKFETQEQKNEAIALEKELTRVTQERFEKTQTWNGALSKDMTEIGQEAKRMFANGLGTAIVDSFEEGSKAFQKFAANFTKQLAEMILQAIIFRSLFGATGYGGLIGGILGGGGGTAAAQGGQFVNKFAAGGVAEVSSPTYFPKFNVLAGEAGREVMTVLSRPQLTLINGVPAQVGYANGQRLAITSADALSGTGSAAMRGSAVVRVELAPGLVASIKHDSIEGARVQIVQDMNSDSNLSRVTRQRMA